MTALFSQFYTAFNAVVIARLAAGGYPALIDGKVAFGPREHPYITGAPRIHLLPVGSAFGAPDIYSINDLGSGERREQLVQEAIHSERVSIEIRCWGVSDPRTDIGDFDATRTLCHAAMQALRAIAPNHAIVGAGKWTKSGADSTYGVEYMFTTAVDSPVLADLLPYSPSTQYAPAGSTAQATDLYISPTDGSSGTGC